MEVTEWLANLSVTYVLVAVAVLFALRMMLAKYRASARMRSAIETVDSALVAIVLVFLVIRPFVLQAFYIPSGSMLPTLRENDRILVNKLAYRFKEPKLGDIIVFKCPPAAGEQLIIPLADAEQRFRIPPSVFRKECNLAVADVLSADGDSGVLKVRLRNYPVRDFRDLEGRIVGVIGEDIARTFDVVSVSGKGDVLAVQLAELADGVEAEDLTGAKICIMEKDYIKRLVGTPGDVLEIKDGALYRNGERLDEAYIPEEIEHTMPPVTVPEGMLFVMGDNRNNSNDSHVWGFLDRNRVVGKAAVRFWPLNAIGLVK